MGCRVQAGHAGDPGAGRRGGGTKVDAAQGSAPWVPGYDGPLDQAAARGLKLPMDRFIVNLENYGNTSTASIPIAMVEAIEKGQIKSGDKLVMVGFGAGLTWGALAAEWTGPIPSKGHVHPEQYRRFAKVRSLVRRAIRFLEGLIYRREL